VAQHPMLIVLLDAPVKLAQYRDANRIKKWFEVKAMRQKQRR
jgi:hypothetical protein